MYEHVAGNLAMIKSFATTGKTPRSTPKLGKDPLAAWARLRDQTLESLDQPGVLQAVAHEPFGPEFGSIPMDLLVGFMAADLSVHVWDMARTAKVDERLDPGAREGVDGGVEDLARRDHARSRTCSVRRSSRRRARTPRPSC